MRPLDSLPHLFHSGSLSLSDFKIGKISTRRPTSLRGVRAKFSKAEWDGAERKFCMRARRGREKEEEEEGKLGDEGSEK